jgi:hypothetical protein
MQYREVKICLVSELVRELKFSHCELLLLEVSSWGMGIVWEPRVRWMSTVESRYQAMTGSVAKM